MKTYRLSLFALLSCAVIMFISGCHTMTKEECSSNYGLIDPSACPPPATPTTAGPCPGSGIDIASITITDADATTYLNNYKGLTPPVKNYGMLVDKCRMYLVAGLAAQGLSIYIGKKTTGTANDYVVMAKYVTAAAETKWADVSDMGDAGGTTCPPGSRCS